MNKADRQKIFDKYGGKCAYCGCELKKGWHIDHIESLGRNFRYDKEKKKLVHDGTCNRPHNDNFGNSNPSCASCNITKATLDIEGFRAYIQQTVDSLNHNRYAAYKFAKRYGLIQETVKPVIFYFETHYHE